MRNVAYLKVVAEPRYWEDATVNGIKDTEGTLMPLRDGKFWSPCIRLSDGMVMHWPDGTTADVHYKVCDQSTYYLLDNEGLTLAKWSGDYVPDAWLVVNDRGYGDYIILTIQEDGAIKNWQAPTVDEREWIPFDGLARDGGAEG